MRLILLTGLIITLFISALWSDMEFQIEIPTPHFADSRSVSDLPVMQRPDEPMLPYVPLRILLPQGERFTGIDVEIEESGRTISDLEIPFFGRQTPMTELYGDNRVDNQLIEKRDRYPAEDYREFGVHRKMGYDILIVNLYPYQYETAGRVLRIADRYLLTIRTEYDPDYAEEQNRMLLTSRSARNEVRRLVDNPEMVYNYHKSPVSRNSLLPDPAEPYSMLVITDNIRAGYFSDYIDWKNETGLTTNLFTVEDIYNTYDGVDNQEKIRNFIIDAYETYSQTDTPLEYVLLGGDDTIVPVRGMYCFVQGLWTEYEDYNIPSDVYYSNLDGNWDANGNGIYGELDDGIDWFAEIAVGRIPAVTAQDFHNFFQKNIHYASNPSYSNDIALMIGQNLDAITWGGDYKDEIIPILPDSYQITTFYEMDGTYSSSAIREAVNNGIGVLNHLGHSNHTTVFGMTGSSVNYLTNTEYGLAYSQGCSTAAFDSGTTPDSYAIGQRFVNAQGAFFAFIGNTRYGWYWPGSTEGASQLFDITFFEGLFYEEIRHIGKTLNYSKETLVNEAIDNNFQHHLWKNGFMLWTFYNQILFGDPSAYFRAANGLFPYLEPVGVVYDDSMGDNDGMVNPGETVKIYIEIHNREEWAAASDISVEFTGQHDGITILVEDVEYPSLSPGSTAVNTDPFIISLCNHIPYGDYNFTVSISALGSEDYRFNKEYTLTIPISLHQQSWPWESPVPLQGAPLIYEDENQLAHIIAVDALSNINYLNFRGEKFLPTLSFEGNMMKSAAMGDLLNNGEVAIVLANRSGLIAASDLLGNQLFSYNSGSQFINTPVLADILGNEELEILLFSVERELFALSPHGQILHGFPLELDSNVLVELAAADMTGDGAAEIILGFVSGELDVIDRQGNSIDGFPLNLGAAINLSPIVLDNRSIITATQGNKLFKIDSGGQIVWELQLDSRVISEAIAADFLGNEVLEIAFATSNGKVFMVGRDGEIRAWLLASLGEAINQPPLAADINDDGNIDIVVSTNSGLVYGLNRNGEILDMFPAPMNTSPASPLFISDIDRDGDFEIGYGTNMGISIIDYKLPAGIDTPWTVYRGNIQRTGFYNDNILKSPSYVLPEPPETELRQNFPNPFNIITTIPFYLEEQAELTIKIYNIRGQLVRELYNGEREQGEGEVVWNGRDNNGRTVASGIYFTSMTAGNRSQVRKMLLLK